MELLSQVWCITVSRPRPLQTNCLKRLQEAHTKCIEQGLIYLVLHRGSQI